MTSIRMKERRELTHLMYQEGQESPLKRFATAVGETPWDLGGERVHVNNYFAVC